MKREADAIVVGSGAGGATIARELARAGKAVLILEKGRNHRRFMGTHAAAALMADRMGMRFSSEGLQCVRGLTTGGTTMLYCGTYRAPASFIIEKLGIDLSGEIEEVRRETGVGKLPQRFIDGSADMMMEAANKLGYRWEVFEKFIDPSRCREGCSACMMGCPTGAKWTARAHVQDAINHGAELIQPITVDRVTHENGKVTGIRDRNGMDFKAPVVILAAGGMGTAPILRRTGIENAGKGIFVDPLVLVAGVYKGGMPRAGTRVNPPMIVGSWEFHESDGFMLSPLVDPWAVYIMQMGMVSVPKAFRVFSYPKTMSVMVKIKDDMAGELFPDGSFSKPLTESDMRKLDRGAEISKEVLVAAGCSEKSVVRGPVRGAHPGGACRIGEVVDEDLQTAITNLYVSDASVFPEALGTPVVATVMAMNKRLARHLLAKREEA